MKGALGDAAREADRIRDPAELAAYAFDLCRPLSRIPERLAEEFVALVAQQKRGGPLLWAIATSASPPASQLAAVQIALRDEPPPSGTAMQVGMLEVECAYAFEDESEDTLVLGGVRPDVEGMQVFGLTIERETTGGAVMDGVASYTTHAVKLDELRDLTADDLGIEPVEVEPADALDRVVAAARRCGELGLRPSSPGVLAVNLLVRASRVDDAEEVLAGLPDGVPPWDDDEDEFGDSLEAWCEVGGLGETRTAFVMFAGYALFEFLAEDCDRPLSTLERADVDEFLLDHMPRSHDRPEDPERFAAALADVLRFLGDTDQLDQARADDLIQLVAELTPEFVELCSDRPAAGDGPAAALVLAMVEDGIDVSDRVAVAEWIADYNSLTIEQRKARVPIPSLGDEVVHAPTRAGKHGQTVKARKAQRQARRRNRRR